MLGKAFLAVLVHVLLSVPYLHDVHAGPINFDVDSRRPALEMGSTSPESTQKVFDNGNRRIEKRITTIHTNLVNLTWPNNTVYYSMTTFNATQRKTMREAMDFLEKGTDVCVKFLPVEPNKTDHHHHIRIMEGSDCSSYIGYRPDGVKQPYQQVFLNPDKCLSPSKIQGILLLILGIHPEHNRPDRDDNIYIDPDIIKKYPTLFNITKQFECEFPYDHGSLTHYTTTKFSKDDYPTIVAKIPDEDICLGNNENATDCDLKKICHLYNCKPHQSLDCHCTPRRKYQSSGC